MEPKSNFERGIEIMMRNLPEFTAGNYVSWVWNGNLSQRQTRRLTSVKPDKKSRFLGPFNLLSGRALTLRYNPAFGFTNGWPWTASTLYSYNYVETKKKNVFRTRELKSSRIKTDLPCCDVMEIACRRPHATWYHFGRGCPGHETKELYTQSNFSKRSPLKWPQSFVQYELLNVILC